MNVRSLRYGGVLMLALVSVALMEVAAQAARTGSAKAMFVAGAESQLATEASTQGQENQGMLVAGGMGGSGSTGGDSGNSGNSDNSGSGSTSGGSSGSGG